MTEMVKLTAKEFLLLQYFLHDVRVTPVQLDDLLAVLRAVKAADAARGASVVMTCLMTADIISIPRATLHEQVAHRLRQAAKGVGVGRNQVPAEPDEIHRAILAVARGTTPDEESRQRIYGGQVVAQALWAAAQTVARRVTEAPDHWVATLARLGLSDEDAHRALMLAQQLAGQMMRLFERAAARGAPSTGRCRRRRRVRPRPSWWTCGGWCPEPCSRTPYRG